MIAVQDQEGTEDEVRTNVEATPGDSTNSMVSRAKSLNSSRDLKSKVGELLADLFDGMALNVEDALFEEMHGMEEQSALASHFNIMRAMRKQGALFRAEFSVLMNVGWVNLLDPNSGRAVRRAASEDMAPRIAKLAVRTELRHKMLTEELNARFGALVGQEIAEHPLTAYCLFQTFWFAIDKLTLTKEEKMLLLPLFDRFVMDRIGPVLALANAQLDHAA